VAFLTIPSFYFDFEDRGSRVSEDVAQLLKRLEKEEVEGLILDLRDNPGGSLSEAQRLTGFFTGKGPVVQVRSSNGQVRSLPSGHPRPLYRGPLIVMTNRNSASAAEIFAGALQDYHRAVLIGSFSTYGKGTVQKTLEIADSMPIFSDRERAGWLKLTFQKYYRVSGSSVQLRGVVPDLVLPSLDDARPGGERSLKYALPHDVIRASPEFQPRDASPLHLPTLAKQSARRAAADPYFQFVREESERIRKRLKDPSLSLNLERRLEDLAASEERRREREVAQEERFALMAKRDREQFQIYRLTIDDVESEELPLDWESGAKTDYLRNAEDTLGDLEKEREWPHGMDAENREALQVLLDLMSMEAVDHRDQTKTGKKQANPSE
jgi:carboxyl-terminal processing protease